MATGVPLGPELPGNIKGKRLMHPLATHTTYTTPNLQAAD